MVGAPGEDWPAQAADWIVVRVDGVRDATTGPAINAARVVVLGLAVALLVAPLLVLLFIGVIRATERGLVALGVEDPVYLVYLAFGVLFTALGSFLWRRSGTTSRKSARSNRSPSI